jgi:hypothetical protein
VEGHAVKIRLFNGQHQLGPVNTISFHFSGGLTRSYAVIDYHSRQRPFDAETYELETLTATQEDPRGDFVNELLAKLPENYDDDTSGEAIVHTWVDDQLSGNDRRIAYALAELRGIRRQLGHGLVMQPLVELDELIQYLE